MNLCLTSFFPSQCDALVEVFFVNYNSFNEVLHQPDFQIKVRIISPRIFPQARLLMFFPPSIDSTTNSGRARSSTMIF